ncbi:DUF2497 domain-containing protein [Roseospira visakhapatnamensis]|uniref:DUF2497 domain-containing protein n=1 Tax=Roseospira visakhapatnamensis TaxID=390880 RepID=A0A7W6RBN9_9PROT|nr:DUF2497 domain-containing protein [Roseospira visakhapatnamensis]MBB4265004.1 hypothetical protein [Roseospira visakhapatnamensis]
MTDKDAQQEPSMEDILASIRKILSEDEEEEAARAEAPPKPAPPPAPEPEPEPEPMLADPEPEPDPLPLLEEDDEDDVLELTDDMIAEDPEPAPPPPPPPPPQAAPPQAPPRPSPPALDDDEPLVAPSVAEMSTRYLNDLSQMVEANAMPVGNGSITLETLARQVIRELVKTWLDDNLPSITERLVQREIERLAKGAGRR